MKARVTQNRHECDTYIPKIDLICVRAVIIT